MLPKISIVTPSYNQVQFIEKTIQSVLNQNYPNLEYIIVDGGSTDGSVDIIRKYEKYLLYWVSEKDNGQSNAINKGFAMCTGDVLNWINSDDRLMPNALYSVVDAVHSYPNAGAWVGCCNLVDPDGNILETNVPRGLVRDKMAAWGFKGHFFQPACFFSKKAWEKYGPLDERLDCCFDLDLYLKIIADYEFFGVGKVWAEATIHRDAKTQKQIQVMKKEISIIHKRYRYVNLAAKSVKGEEEIAFSFLKPGLLRTMMIKLYKLVLQNFYNARLKLKGIKNKI